MRLVNPTAKKYMVDNNIDLYKCEKGKIAIVEQNRRVLDRGLIEDIEQYKVDAVVKMSFKSPGT
jgi:hypothetical protein